MGVCLIAHTLFLFKIMNIQIQQVIKLDDSVLVGAHITAHTESGNISMITGTMEFPGDIDYKDHDVLKGAIIHRLTNLNNS